MVGKVGILLHDLHDGSAFTEPVSAAHAGTLPKQEESVIVKIADMCFAIQLAFLKLSNEPKVGFGVGELMQEARDQTNS